jgi:hypothetical protein
MTEKLNLKEEKKILKDYKEKVIEYNRLIKERLKGNDSKKVNQARKEVDKIEERVWELGYCLDCFDNWGYSSQDEKELVKNLEKIKLVSALIKWGDSSQGGDCLKHLIILARSLERQGNEDEDYYVPAVKKIWEQRISYQVANTYFWSKEYGEVKYFQTQKVWYWAFAYEALKKNCSECDREFSGSESVLEFYHLPNNAVDYLERQLDEKYKDKDNSWLLKNSYEALAGDIFKDDKHEEENKKLWNEFIQKVYHPECLRKIDSELFSKMESSRKIGWWAEGKNCYCLPEWSCLRDIKRKREQEKNILKYYQICQEIYQVQAEALANKMPSLDSKEELNFFGSKRKLFENAYKKKAEKASEYAKEVEQIQKELQRLDYLEARHFRETQLKEAKNE